MKIIELQKDNYQDWDNFCLKSDDAWFWHTTAWLEYNLAYKPEFKPVSKSFFIMDNNQVIAICPLILEQINGIYQLSFAGGNGPMPSFVNEISEKKLHQLYKIVYDQIDIIAKKNKATKVLLRCSVLNNSFINHERQSYNIPVRYGYTDTSLMTQIIEVSKSLVELRSKISHGHDSAIDKALKSLEIRIFDSSSITKEIYTAYKELHKKAAGRVTRPDRTWEIMFDILRQRQAFLVGASLDGGLVGFSYFYLYKNNALYGSACNDPEVEEIPIGQAIQWEAIKWMNSSGVKHYDIGLQFFGPTLFNTPSAKEVAISKFKRGFGGITVPFYMSEKYYSQEAFEDDYKKRLDKYSQVLQV